MVTYETKDELLRKGVEIVGKRIGDVDRFGRLSEGKGSIGHVVEESHFGYEINSSDKPDFSRLGVELKVTPYIITRGRKYSAKERLVLNIINYMEEYKRTFETSSFWAKNKSLLIMFYEHLFDVHKSDFQISKCILFEYPEEDLLIIRSDWEQIVGKIRDGKAHEISEADTNYLGACTKGRTAASSLRHQPFNDVKAKQRAYCLKQSYMTHIIRNYIFGKSESEKIIKTPEVLKQSSFEEYILAQIYPYLGRSQS